MWLVRASIYAEIHTCSQLGGRAGGKGGRENLSMYNRTEQKCNEPPAGYEALLLEPYKSLTRALLEPY